MLMISGLVAWAIFSLATPGSVGSLSVLAPSEPNFSPLLSMPSQKGHQDSPTSTTKTKGQNSQLSSATPSGASVHEPSSSASPRKKGKGDDSGSPEGNPVPEPGTLALLGSGLLALAFYRRRGSESHSS